ncbi:MAG TPA: hypothetical protein VIJ77_06245 [Candidatus Tumulicola sp.]
MSFFFRWLNLSKDRQRVGLRPHRDLELPDGYEAAYDRVLRAIELVLGASIATDERRGGTIEAAFGLVNNERVRCTLRPIDDSHTAVRVEAFFPAGATVRDRSMAVEALADRLVRDADSR